MIPILYEKDEVVFISNGLGRLRDCISCTVTEERNGIYECDFTYPVDGARYGDILLGRIIGVTHDDTGEIQPFDIVSCSKPINGIVSFHAVHVSYRQGGYTVHGTGINSLSSALNLFASAEPLANPFSYSADFTSNAYFAAADGVPHTVRQMLGGMGGSILDTYGGELEFDRFNVRLRKARGVLRPFTIRYGVNMLEYKDETDHQGSFTSCVPFWKGIVNGRDVIVIGDRVDSGLASYNGRNDCVPLDLSDKFENKPTKTQVQNMAAEFMSVNSVNLPSQNITVDFVRLQEMGYDGFDALYECRLCDTISVEFPLYEMAGRFKIVKVVYNVLADRYDEMELGTLSTTLAEALGISNSAEAIAIGEPMPGDGIVYDDFDFTVSYSAGTVGTRGYESSAAGAKTGYKPIAATVIAGNTYYNIFNARVADGGTVTLSAFRATTGARSGDAVTVRVAYLKV